MDLAATVESIVRREGHLAKSLAYLDVVERLDYGLRCGVLLSETPDSFRRALRDPHRSIRLLELAEPLRASAGFRKIERKRTLFLLEAVKPAIHLVIGDETVIEEDDRGYRCQFPAMFKVVVSDTRDTEDASDAAVAYLQEAIEADGQLNGGGDKPLANKATYEGELPFTEEISKPEGGAVVSYNIEYRRYRGDVT